MRRPLLKIVLDGSRLVHLVMLTRAIGSLAAVSLLAAILSLHAFPHDAPARDGLGLAVFVVLGSGASFLAVGRPGMAADRAQRRQVGEQQAKLAAQAEQHEFASGLQDAFEMVETESDALALVARALPLVYQGPGELLLADSSRAHLNRVAVPAAGPAGCSVRTPARCPAVRRGHSMVFESSEALSACPRLAERGPGLAAFCVPVMILGSPMGVLHLTGPAQSVEGDRATGNRGRIESIAVQVGGRITALRAASSTELAASTDPLTGLLNRRSLIDGVEELAASGRPYAVAFADLDSFKALNDTFGHATGDRALRLFAGTLIGAMRDDALICRYGGEEFVVVLPGCSVGEAAPVVHRVRAELREALATSGTPAFTASFGLANSGYTPDPLEIIALADEALLQAKADGRDRLVIGDRPDRPTAQVSPRPPADRSRR